MTQLVLPVLAAVAMLGVALVTTMRAERRREIRHQRLRALAAMGPIDNDEPAPSLRRPLSRTAIRDFFLLSALWARLDAALAATGNKIGAPHLVATGLIAAVVVMAFSAKVMSFAPILIVLLGAAAGLGAAAQLLRLAQTRYQNQFLDLFPDALELIGRAVKAGLPVFDAMEVAAREIGEPVGRELQLTLDEMRVGVDIDDAMQRTADRLRVSDFRFFAVALKLQRRTGGSLAETLANLSRTIRRRKAIRLKARALTSESKSSAVVLALLPIAVGGIMFLVNRPLILKLFIDPRGRFMLGVAVLSLISGVVAMGVIIKKSLR